ncbi:MAG: NAD(P)/FAD-dependent oxidoreductase [Oscillospiraceae bacterium]|nr:NAD(P)/FAD-dependent oxidoreductase [Oscillospiraceae bacterium]
MKADIIVIGGGAAGCMAALSAAEEGARVLLLERNQKLGRKLYITGKGRCNLTNNCPPQQVLDHTPRNGRFLHSALKRFPPSEVMAFFERLGVPLKTERGGRVFPQSDRAADVIDALLLALRRAGVAIVQDRATALLLEAGEVTGVRGECDSYPAHTVILATGGMSYPLTGSTGDGYEMARAAGHTILPPKPSLVPLVARGDICARMQGLSLRNVAVRVKNQKNKVMFAEQGELLFTHFGLSGPLILSASAHMREFETDTYRVCIDLKPALDEQTLEKRILRELAAQPNRNFVHILETLAPRLLVPVLSELSGIAQDTKANMVTKEARRRLLSVLKCIEIEIAGPRPLEEAVITSGGVQVTEVNPTMASKKTAGLYLCGEVLDVDAYTGGYNLQIAWCTGRTAGVAAAKAVKNGGTEHGV